MTVRYENSESAEEADLIDRLRAEGDLLLALVAETELGIVGHILFSRMRIERGRRSANQQRRSNCLAKRRGLTSVLARCFAGVD